MRRLLVLAVALLGFATACSNDPDDAGEPAGSQRGITVGVYQLRQGYGSREFQLQVANNTDRLIRVERATYVSSRFEEPAVWREGTRIPGGMTIDLPVQLSRTRCTSSDQSDEVVLEFRRGNGTLRRETYRPELLYDAVQRFVASDCAGRDISRIADVHVGNDIDIRGEGRDSVAELPLIIEPRGTSGSFTLDSILATTLISPSRGGDSWNLDIDVAATDQPRRRTLQIGPTRCDSHALSDNSQGTEFTAVFTLADGQTTHRVLGTSRHLAGRLTSFVAAHCGYGPDVD